MLTRLALNPPFYHVLAICPTLSNFLCVFFSTFFWIEFLITLFLLHCLGITCKSTSTVFTIIVTHTKKARFLALFCLFNTIFCKAELLSMMKSSLSGLFFPFMASAVYIFSKKKCPLILVLIKSFSHEELYSSKFPAQARKPPSILRSGPGPDAAPG